MKKLVVAIVLLFKTTCIENSILSLNYVTLPNLDETETSLEDDTDSNVDEKVLPLKNYNDNSLEKYSIDNNYGELKERSKKPCSVIVMSNIQNPIMQSLLRKYRYDANGVLIPNSVKYFIKFPQGLRSSPLLVPLHDKAFSPLGGFVRYYKEVPPIPRSW